MRNTGITGRSGAVRGDGCKTSPSALKSHTHILTQRWRGLSLKAPMLHLRCTDTHKFRCKCTCTLVQCKADVCVHMCMHTHINFSCAVSSKTVYILLGCAPISRINEEVSHFTAEQRVGLWGTNGWSLQFLKSVFNNAIDF